MAVKTLSQAIAAFRNSKKAQILTLIGIIVATTLVFQVAEAQPQFCNSCHEMNYHYVTWQNSTHANSTSCLDCHSEPGISGQIDVKIRSIQELFSHLTGSYDFPIRSSAEVGDEQCLKCHQDAANISDKNIDLHHDVHLESGIKCIDCHANIVHNDPNEPKVMPLTQCESCHQKHNEFPMTNDHSTLKCGECHVNGIYIKIDPTCESCHSSADDHIYNISTNCEACHTLEGWGQAKGNHTRLPLTDKHSNLDCTECHPKEAYKEVVTLCESCHNPPTEHFNTNESCESCHTPIGWTPAKYDHSFYPLEDKHQAIQCTECHINSRYVDIPKKCELCHNTSTDHEFMINSTCEACHDVKGWKPATSHSSFQLTEKHASLQCSQCHSDKQYTETKKTCESCHDLPDEHFNTPDFNATEGCGNCHTPGGWKTAEFDHSFYPLTGEHDLANCTECHIDGQYLDTPQSCSSCHTKSQQHPTSDDNCNRCHNSGAWLPASYDHPGTTLTGSHTSLSCSSCHSGGVYTGLSSSCENCHSTPVNHPVGDAGNCGSCHSTSDWKSTSYDHSSFPLTGSHASLSCSSCHFGGVYTGLSTACISCHQTPSTHSGLSQNCLPCHSVNTFSPSIFVHPQVAEHFPSGDRRLSCSSCHRPSYSVASCIGSNCHSTNNPRDN